MGFEQGGIHQKIGEQLGLSFKTTLLDDVMQIHLPGNTPALLVKRSKWQHLQQLQQTFPTHDQHIKQFFKEIWTIAEEIKYLMKTMPVMPPQTVQDWQLLLKALRGKSLLLGTYFFKTIGDLVKKHNLHTCKPFLMYLDGQLIDSMQTGFHYLR